MPKTDEFDFSDSDSVSRPPTSYLNRNNSNGLNCVNIDRDNNNCGGNGGSSTSSSINNNLNNNNNNNSNNNINNEIRGTNSNSAINNNNNNNSNNNNNALLGVNQNSNCSIDESNGGNSIGGGGSGSGHNKKYRHQNYSKNIYIGTKNAEKWDITRARLQFKNDVEFVAYLLKLAENDTDRIASLPPITSKSFGNIKLEPNLSTKDFDNNDYLSSPATSKKSQKRVQFNETINGFMKASKKFSEFSLKGNKHDDKQLNHGLSDDNIPEVLDCRIAEKIKNELEQKSASEFGGDNESFRGALCLKKPKEFQIYNHSDDDEDDDDDDDNNLDNSEINRNSQFRIRDRSRSTPKKKIKKLSFNGKIKNDKTESINKYDEFDDDDDDMDDENDNDNEDDDDEDDDNDIEEGEIEELNDDLKFNNVRLKQTCRDCTLSHEYDDCPYRLAKDFILDSMDLEQWTLKKIDIERLKAIKNEKDDDNNDKTVLDEDDSQNSLSNESLKDKKNKIDSSVIKEISSFAESTVPIEFELKKIEINSVLEYGIITKVNMPKFTRLGPLIGKSIQNNDIPDDCNMKNIYEIHNGTKSEFISTEYPNLSNWLRFIRPASNYDEHNINLISIERKAYFVTSIDVQPGCELLYWSDDCNSSWRKKQTEKTNCGGCNVKFDNALHYRTHCSIFHDPSFSLTIRKYHCKICGEAVLGKENIIKHAEQMHDGKGAYQCQFCNKFFLRLNYLEMHRTYGCSANPQRTRPLCDFCGKKFCQPQKLKVHIKRMHGDMADLRDFQCKLCSKLLGSRAALQRHNKEVHSRNSAVVSCPRCQKLFQNRSNLKIHMLTHSGVRPFKCAESECTAAFTTKQCLQFHYKKVHNYTQEQMPKIERSVAYTFDAYSGGMKADFLEQAPRRRRKSLEDQHSLLSSSLLDSNNESDFSDDNIYESVKKPSKSIKDLCRNETNLSLLSSKLTSMFGGASNSAANKEVVVPKKRKRKYRKNNLQENPVNPQIQQQQQQQQHHQQQQQQQQQQLLQQHQHQLQNLANAGPGLLDDDDDIDDSDEERLEQVRRKQNVQLSLVETFLSTTAQRAVAAAAAAAAVNNSTNNMDDPKLASIIHDSELPDDHDNNFRHGSTNSRDSSINSSCQNLVVSKGSKKWIGDDDPRHHLQTQHLRPPGITSSNNFMNHNESNDDDETSNKILPNRDILARFININNNNNNNSNNNNNNNNNNNDDQNHHSGVNHHHASHEEDENSSFLDVVDSNNQAGHQISQHQQQQQQQFNDADDHSQMHMNSMNHSQSFMSSFYNNPNSRTGSGSVTNNTGSSSASMLVEAALNSVGNIMDNDNNGMKCSNNSGIDSENDINSQMNVDTNRYGNNGSDEGAGADNDINNMDNLENEIKMMKSLNQFPMQMPALPIFQQQNSNSQQQSSNNLSSCNISPNNSTPNHNPGSNNNDIDVDPNSTPRGQQIQDSDRFSNHHHTPPSPQVISPGRDYSIFNSNTNPNNNANNVNNNISVSSPIPSLQHRRSTNSAGVYPEHELISPASSPAIPRYDFNSEICRKREQIENERAHNMSTQNQLSSDEENSLIAQNNTSGGDDMRMKFPQSQLDLMYSKYESMANSSIKYNSNQQDLDVQDFRNNSSNDLSDLQGLDMTSRSNQVGSAYHNFQLPPSASSSLGASGSGASNSSSGLGRYHHHIYDILSEREQQQHQQQQQHQHQQQDQLAAMQQHQSIHNMLPDQLNDQDHDQTTSVDLSRTANYVVSPPPSIPPYAHPHHDMLRMVSLDLTPNTNMGNQRSFLSSQMQHNTRDSLDHHRLLSTAEQHRLLANSEQHRLLVDPTAHLLMEQNNRLLSSDQSRLLGESAAQNRHMSRGFGAYHQVTSGNYHPSVRPVLPSPNHHTPNPSNYHPFPAYY